MSLSLPKPYSEANMKRKKGKFSKWAEKAIVVLQGRRKTKKSELQAAAGLSDWEEGMKAQAWTSVDVHTVIYPPAGLSEENESCRRKHSCTLISFKILQERWITSAFCSFACKTFMLSDLWHPGGESRTPQTLPITHEGVWITEFTMHMQISLWLYSNNCHVCDRKDYLDLALQQYDRRRSGGDMLLPWACDSRCSWCTARVTGGTPAD